jgi:hypothetical protein
LCGGSFRGWEPDKIFGSVEKFGGLGTSFRKAVEVRSDKDYGEEGFKLIGRSIDMRMARRNIFLALYTVLYYLPTCAYNKVHTLTEPSGQGEGADQTSKDLLLFISKFTGTFTSLNSDLFDNISDNYTLKSSPLY